MKWVTREKVGVDRMACAWLIRRFIDADAEFLFVPTGETNLPEGAEPFDMPGVRLTHRQGHCSFHTMVREYDLKEPILNRIAQIVDEADITQEINLEPSAPGLELICRGIRRISENDMTALERGSMIYEALYAQLEAELQRG